MFNFSLNEIVAVMLAGIAFLSYLGKKCFCKSLKRIWKMASTSRSQRFSDCAYNLIETSEFSESENEAFQGEISLSFVGNCVHQALGQGPKNQKLIH